MFVLTIESTPNAAASRLRPSGPSDRVDRQRGPFIRAHQLAGKAQLTLAIDSGPHWHRLLSAAHRLGHRPPVPVARQRFAAPL